MKIPGNGENQVYKTLAAARKALVTDRGVTSLSRQADCIIHHPRGGGGGNGVLVRQWKKNR